MTATFSLPNLFPPSPRVKDEMDTTQRSRLSMDDINTYTPDVKTERTTISKVMDKLKFEIPASRRKVAHGDNHLRVSLKLLETVYTKKNDFE